MKAHSKSRFSMALMMAIFFLSPFASLNSVSAFAQDGDESKVKAGADVEPNADDDAKADGKEEAEAEGLDKKIDKLFGKATGWYVGGVFAMVPIMEGVAVPWVLFPLVIGAVFFTLYFGFPNLRHFGTAINIVRGKYDDLEEGGSTEISEKSVSSVDGDNPDTIRIEGHDGEVSHFQALTAALSGTVGLGNIAGVAIALSLGGPGATFWMIICGLLGMSTKFVECTLGVSYREIDSKGTVFGGPMYYLSKGLAEKGLGGLGKVLAVLFAVMCIGGSFGGGNMFQANQAFQLFATQTGVGAGNGWLFGLVMAVFVGIVIIGGIKSIASVTDKIVPLMVGVYVVAALFILILNAALIPKAILEIFNGAFAPTAIAGGIVGVIVQGFKRAAFSNEAGIGSASIAHSAVKTKHPASEGLVALLEPFIDTVVVCTMTALVIVISNFDGEVMSYGTKVGNDAQAVVATSGAFAATISWFPWVLMVAVVLFAFSTMISWSYYGYQAWSYLFGRSKTQEYVYKALFCAFVVIGAAASMESVVGFSDAMIFSMLVPNMIGLFFLAPRVKQELEKYLAAIKKS
ncbi:MAG: alanine/glycine:cation symporter family protein [Mariniblastus sp.]